MDINYLKIRDTLKIALADVKKYYKNAPTKTFEDKQAILIVENIIPEIETAVERIEYYSKPVIEGCLKQMKSGRFDLINSEGRSLKTFTCGSNIELYNFEDNTWYPGRVEHTTRDGYTGYYFYNMDLNDPFLDDGMRARIRVDMDIF